MNNTLLKGLAVLELLSRTDRPLSLTQIARDLGMVKSNVHRLMQAMVDTNFVLRDADSGSYTASIKLWELGSAVLAKLDLRRHAETEMESLMQATGESVHLSVLDGSEVVYLHKVESFQPVRAYSQIGGRAPAYCVATGKVQLAHAIERYLEEISNRLEAKTVRTITNPRAFLREMERIRQQGYAINRGEWRAGVWGIAAPVMDSRGSVIAAVGISGPAERFKRAAVAQWTPAVVVSADHISHALGSGRGHHALARARFGPR